MNPFKVFRTNALAGAGFGVIISLIFYQLGVSPWALPQFLLVITSISGFFSGAAGLAGSYLEEYLKAKGVANGLLRQLISFFIIGIGTVTLFGVVVSALGFNSLFPALREYALWGGVAGLTFGAVFALYSYRTEQIQERLAMLEKENLLLAQLARKEELLREAARNLAVTEERTRMARDLHDSIAQGMHGIIYSLRTMENVIGDNPQGIKILKHLDLTAQGTLKELRRLMMELQPSPLEDQSLEEALRLHCQLFASRLQIELDLVLKYKGGLQPDQEVAIYRILQESLANIQKYAEARKIFVSLKDQGEIVQLLIRDDGKGFDTTSSNRGHGLVNMANRTRQNGGSIQIDSKPGLGTTISCEFRKF